MTEAATKNPSPLDIDIESNGGPSNVGPPSNSKPPLKSRRLIEEIKQRADCIAIFRRFWPEHFREDGNSLCPFHEDRNPSLQLSKDRAYCHAESRGWDCIDHFSEALSVSKGKAIYQLSAELGIRKGRTVGACKGGAPPSGCTLEEYSKAKRLPLDELAKYGLRDGKFHKDQAVLMPYYDANGQETSRRYRIAMSGDKFRWRKGDKAQLYGLWRMGKRRTVTIVEGESDCHTLWHHGIPALGLPGAATWREKRDAPHFDDVDQIYVVVEPDQGGEAVKKWLGKSSIAGRSSIVTLDKFKDASELHQAHPDHEEFMRFWTEAIEKSVKVGLIESADKQKAIGDAWEHCKTIAREVDILDAFSKDLVKLGVVGEVNQAKLLYLAITSRLLDKPVSVVVKGSSSSGKSYISQKVLEFFPVSAFYALTATSDKALIYSDEEFSHRFLVLYEASALNSDFGAYVIRSLLSEGRIRYDSVRKSAEGGYEPISIAKEGPTGLLVTTTWNTLHPENETRMFSVITNDTKEHTAAILTAIADESNGRVDLVPWQALQTWLEAQNNSVTIPFAPELARKIPPVAVRLRRDFSALLQLIKAHAILHQANRKRDAFQVVATLDDYDAVKGIIGGYLAEGLDVQIPATVRQTVKAVQDLLARPGTKETSVAQVAKTLNIDKSSASRRVKGCLDKGYLVNNETQKGKPYKIAMGEPLPTEIKLLPDRDELSGVAPTVGPLQTVADPACNRQSETESQSKEECCSVVPVSEEDDPTRPACYGSFDTKSARCMSETECPFAEDCEDLYVERRRAKLHLVTPHEHAA